MKAITLRNIPPWLAHRISRRAAQYGTSVNKTVMRMLSEPAAPLARKKQPRAAGRPRRDLGGLAGSWSAQEADEFDAYLAEMRRGDPELRR